MSKPYSQAILLLTDKHSEMVNARYNELKKSVKKQGEVIIAFHQKEDAIPTSIKMASHFIFTSNILTEMGYRSISQSLIPGSNHFPLLKFYRQNPTYDYYWIIEDDVRFNGDWEYFFKTFHSLPRDFMSCYIFPWIYDKTWHWWNLEHPKKKIPLQCRLKSFNPIYRISNIALKYIDMILLDKWYGHHEVLLPTLLKYGGYTLADFGGDGPYVLPGFKNRFYINQGYSEENGYNEGTMRWRPIFSHQGNESGKLYHPVKDIT